jgi:hypothetical protein
MGIESEASEIDTSRFVRTEEEQAAYDQVRIVLQSATFRNAPALRRLLNFLTEKYLAGEADQLKEYSIGVDALGKPESFDPKRDSIVRLQMGRLRQKLAEYQRAEGSDDPYIVDLPRGTFRISCCERPLAPVHMETPLPVSRPLMKWAFVAALIWSVIVTGGLWRELHKTNGIQSLWTPALETLWRPMLSSPRPLVIAIEEPPFAQISGFGVYRELKLNRWNDILQSPDVSAIRKALNSPSISPNYYYAPMGEVTGSFLLGRLLGSRVAGLSLIGTRELSWRQLGNSDVIYLGVSAFVSDIVNGLPLQPELGEAAGGISNPHPAHAENRFYADRLPSGPAGDGQVYALVTHLPGPAGTGTFTTFSSSSTSGRLAAVQYFTDPSHAETLVQQMKHESRDFPYFYQVLLKVDFKDGVPTRTSYVLCHELRL